MLLLKSMNEPNRNKIKKIITPIYVINIIFQSLFSLISPIAVCFLAAWLLDRYTPVGSWIYVILIMLGVFSGLYSMVVFILRACRALESIENQNSPRGGGK